MLLSAGLSDKQEACNCVDTIAVVSLSIYRRNTEVTSHSLLVERWEKAQTRDPTVDAAELFFAVMCMMIMTKIGPMCSNSRHPNSCF